MPAPKAPPLTPGRAALPEQQRDFAVGRLYLVARADGKLRPAVVLNSRPSKLAGTQDAYISFVGEDKRLDTWVPASALGEEVAAPGPSRLPSNGDLAHAASSPANGRDLREDVSEASTPEREHAAVTRVRNFEDVRFGEYLIKTWYYSPYPLPLPETGGMASAALLNAEGPKRGRKRKEPPGPTPGASKLRPSAPSTSDLLAAGVGKGGEGARGRLWACDLCFKYMRTRAGWEMHTTSCTQLQPPGRKVYQRGSYTIWEVDGANATLYCQNLSLFGKLFIDHKVENFLFYVLCDAATSKRDQVMAFFSKEKLSYDDYNLACIVTFPPHQNRGFGKLLIEFSYYLTRHPSTRPPSLSPGTPERPLSDLGLKGYMAYWTSVVLRVCRQLLSEAAPPPPPTPTKPKATEGRSLRERRPPVKEEVHETVVVNGHHLTKRLDPVHKGQYAITTTLSTLARAAHLRTDDVALTLEELGFLKQRHSIQRKASKRRDEDDEDHHDDDDGEALGEWKDVEVVITREGVDEQWDKWRVRDAGVLDEKYSLL
ncbi:hypothetical protein Q8F55_004864 [Vanrija albida]|uniref:histone acetyltransferase n=1 Tax=Vanrija albida TaxID=181172 RepID=A0ABR3Q0T3_9TREE